MGVFFPFERVIRRPSPVKAGRLLRNRPRAGQSADWPDLDRGRSPDFLVTKGKTPQKPLVSGFCYPGVGGPDGSASSPSSAPPQAVGGAAGPEMRLNLRRISTTRKGGGHAYFRQFI